MIPAFFERMKLHFKALRRKELSDEDQLALAKVTARITGTHQSQYMLGLLDEKGSELKCPGYARRPIGSTLVGQHSQSFGPFGYVVTVAGAAIYAPVTGDPVSKVNVAMPHTIRVGDTLNFNYTAKLE